MHLSQKDPAFGFEVDRSVSKVPGAIGEAVVKSDRKSRKVTVLERDR